MMNVSLSLQDNKSRAYEDGSRLWIRTPLSSAHRKSIETN